MDVISAHDLQFKYSTTAIPPDDPRRTGNPDHTLLNRGELYEVLPFLNRFCKNTKYTDGREFGKAEALKAERMLHRGVPASTRSHANVTQWLISNWAQQY